MIDLMTRIGLVVLMSCGLAASTAAIPVEVNLVPVDNSAGGDELEGFTTTDIILNIPGRLTGSQMLIELERGSIYQHSLGADLPPAAAVVELEPALAFDTFVAYGGPTAGSRYAPFGIYGEAPNLDRNGSFIFSESQIHVAWGATSGDDIPEETSDFLIARVTLSEDAEGQWLYLASSGMEYTVVAPEGHPVLDEAHGNGGALPTFAGSGAIRSGQLQLHTVVPEPGTLGLLGAAVAAGFALVRQRAVRSARGASPF